MLILFTGFASAEDNSTDLLEMADDGDTLGDSVKPIKEASDLIKNADEGSTVKLNGTYQIPQAYAEGSAITINRSITIEGEGDCVFDGNGYEFEINVETGNNVVIKNIKFVTTPGAGKTPYQISNQGNLTLFNCTFENINTPNLIFNLNIMSIDNCVFKDNVASANLIDSHEEYTVIPKFHMTNSKLISNDAKELIYLFQVKNTMISDNLFYNNTVKGNLISSIDQRTDATKKDNYFTFSRNVLISNVNGTSPAKMFIKPPFYEKYISGSGKVPQYTLVVTIKDNFWGRNIHDEREITLLDYVVFGGSISYGPPVGWEKDVTCCNVEVEKLDGGNYKLCYVNKDGQIINLQNATFNIKDARTNDVLAHNVGIGTFHLNSDINTSDILILTSENKTVNMAPAKLVYTITGSNYADIHVFVTLYDQNNNPLANKCLRLDIYSPEEKAMIDSGFVHTNDKGFVYCDGSHIAANEYYPHVYIFGRYSQFNLTTIFSSEEYGFTKENLYFKVKKIPFKATASPVTTTYKSQASVKITLSYTKYPEYSESISFYAELYQGKKLIQTYYMETDSYTASIKLPKLDAGTYTLKMTTGTDEYAITTKDVKITVNKLKLTAKAPKVTNKFKKSKYFQVTVKNGKKIKIKVKVYTGKKAKTYTLKTNSKGIAKLNTKTLKIGKHKVVISSGNPNYKISAKSLIKIKK